MTFKNKRVLIPLPDSGFYSDDRRRRDVMELNIDIEDAILSVLKTLTEPTRSIDPFQNNQELLELAFDSFEDHRNNNRGIEFIKNVKTHDDLLVLEEILKHAKSCDDSLGYIKKRVAELLLLAESFLAPLMPKMRQVGLPITVENFRRHPSFASFDVAVPKDLPLTNELQEEWNLLFDKLRLDNLRKSQLSLGGSKEVSKTIDEQIEETTSEIFRLKTELLGQTDIKPSQDFLTVVKETLSLSHPPVVVSLVVDTLRLLLSCYRGGLTEQEYLQLMKNLSADSEFLLTSLASAYSWYDNTLNNLKSKLMALDIHRVNAIWAKEWNEVEAALRGIFMGLVKHFYFADDKTLFSSNVNLQACYAAMFFDACVDISIIEELCVRESFEGYVEPFSPTMLHTPESIVGRYLLTHRYDDIGNFYLSDFGHQNKPLYATLNDNNWSSAWLTGISKLKKTAVIFKVEKPLIMLGQIDSLESKASTEFIQQAINDGYDSIFHTQVSDTSAGQMLLLKPTKETVQLITPDRSLIDNYFKELNTPSSTKFFIQTANYQFNGPIPLF